MQMIAIEKVKRATLTPLCPCAGCSRYASKVNRYLLERKTINCSAYRLNT